MWIILTISALNYLDVCFFTFRMNTSILGHIKRFPLRLVQVFPQDSRPYSSYSSIPIRPKFFHMFVIQLHVNCLVDPDTCIKPAVKPCSFKYYEYVGWRYLSFRYNWPHYKGITRHLINSGFKHQIPIWKGSCISWSYCWCIWCQKSLWGSWRKLSILGTDGYIKNAIPVVVYF